MSHFTVSARDFRVLDHLEWSPEGVCVLTGPNGAGKSTTLDILVFLRALFTVGHEAAFRAVDGVSFQRWGAEPGAPVEFSVVVGDIRWNLRFPMSAQGVKGNYGEELLRANETILRAEMFRDQWKLGAESLLFDQERCCAKVLWDRGQSMWMRPLVDVLEGMRMYDTYWLNQVKRVEPTSAGDSYLHFTGRNLWSVLANWKASPLRYRGQFDWVIGEARKAFPGIIGTIEFDRGLPYLFRAGATDPAEGFLPNRAADGLLTGLLHLTAVAGARNGSVIGFDEVENQLHPFAIRELIGSMRAQASQRNLTIILTTHSPVVLNQFRDDPRQVYVMDRSDPQGPVPVSMLELHSEEWVAQAKLGTLYERLAFGAPTRTEDGK
jgi:hypothetical protein